MEQGKFRSLAIFFAIAILSTFLFGGVRIESSVDRSQILIGDRVTYTVTMRYPKGYTIATPPIAHNLGQFEIKDFTIGKPGDLGNEIMQSFTFMISTYDTGTFEIPPTGFAYRDSAGQEGIITTQPITIKVGSLLGDRSTWQLRDVKPPVPYPFPWKTVLYFAIPLVLVTGAIITFIVLRKRKMLGVFELAPKARPAYEVALERLSNLQIPDAEDAPRVKAFHIELSEIVRQYIEDMFKIPALEQITPEIIEGLRDKISEPALGNLNEMLTLSDLVKFAKFLPPHSENVEALEDAKMFVQQTMPHEEPARSEVETEEVKTV